MNNDKTLIIIALTIIALASMIIFNKDALQVVNSVVSGLLGMAIGQELKQNSP
ncbi:MAG: hypothetical protein HQK63_00120 [Desulfamplus sp.]|nr:hypothetical protein [Desulfamplus sp.]